MTKREKVFAALLVLVIVFLAIAGRAWLQERDARTKAEATQAAQQQVITAAQSKIDSAAADQKQTAAWLQQQLAALQAQKQQPPTPPQFVVDMQKAIPNLPQAPQVVTPAPVQQTVNGKTETVQPPAAVEIPAADLPALQAYKLNCDATGLKLDACTKTGADLQVQLAGTETQLGAMTKERDSWKTAAKGGSIWSRVGRNLKCLAISGGAAYAGSRIDVSNPGVGAVIGTVAGGVGCEVF